MQNKEKLEELKRDHDIEIKMRTDFEFALETIAEKHNITSDDISNFKDTISELKEYWSDISCDEVFEAVLS